MRWNTARGFRELAYLNSFQIQERSKKAFQGRAWQGRLGYGL